MWKLHFNDHDLMYVTGHKNILCDVREQISVCVAFIGFRICRGKEEEDLLGSTGFFSSWENEFVSMLV